MANSAGATPHLRLHSPLPRFLPAGAATTLYIAGTALDGDRPARALTLVTDGRRTPVVNTAMPRFDVPERRGGFWGTLDVVVASDADEVLIEGEFVGRDSRPIRRELARIPVKTADEGPGQDRAITPETIAIVMTTYNPDPDLFEAQIKSIQAQTDPNWVCVISDDRSDPGPWARVLQVVADDPRFAVSQAPERLGVYRNFERGLSMIPPTAQLIALSDQDDVWHPEKLQTLRSAIGSAALVYSDQRVTDNTGKVLSDTMWRRRANNWTDIVSLLVANTVTGAAALMRREVVDLALPFPDCPGMEFHDHWLALVALASGPLQYVDRPLYDYVQHRDAVLGRVVGRGSVSARGRLRFMRPQPRRWRGAYFLGYLPLQMRARTLLLRCGGSLTPSQRRGLELYIRAERSPLAFLWFVVRPLRMLIGRTETQGSEWELAVGITWRWLAALVARIPGWPDRYLLDTSFPDPLSFAQRRLGRWRERI